ncbi:MAG TPA: asparagine synthase (glutamine-hydrolyzing) [Humidesulfovibrio sp.]|uniref:asparagine synthase (glutamine-hydrolyzing) n=1 Tax=Humidesulfovibrio sp. TaxID=2910988 RepID=UPI002CD7D258|nr:asparagine synthase (glutamine-hydrolyzing) [Humidesulfovibrio sp.]HWR04920.1 asparagine synthase (glutamine-hydrolyzing) [Humidesulfovibrio sp.]
MCGICGHIRAGGLRDADLRGQFPARLEGVLAGIAHRGPNATGRWACEHAALGHARLSVLDLDERAGQPMHDPHTGNVIVFNGEIYNFRALRAELEKRGETFRTTGDTEVLLAMYRIHGQDCLKHLRGMFAFALWDAARQELFLARDPLGKKPLVYFEADSGLVFASEIRALRAHPDCPTLDGGALDPEALDLYLSLGYVPAPKTILKGVRKLPPGCCATYSCRAAAGLSIRRYWEMDFRDKLNISEAEALDLAWAELRESVRLRLESDVPLGLLLSGGVDSSLVAAVLAELCPGKVQAFCIGFGEKKYNELPHAQAVAKHLGITLHHEIMPPASLAMLPEVVERYGEPYADDSALPALALSRMARSHITVALGGDGGDELCCGYPTYRHARMASALNALVTPPLPGDQTLRALTASDSSLAQALRESLAANIWPEAKPLLRAEGRMKPMKDRLYTPQTARAVAQAHADWFLPWLRRAYERAQNPVERILFIDNSTSLPDDLLVKMDIASMAHALEVRSPLLDQKLVELFARFPVRLKVRGRETKYLLKRMAETRVPPHVLYRRKQGFDLPIREWMAGPMRGFVREALSQAAPALKEHLRLDAALTLAEEHAHGKNHKNMLWRLVVLALWSKGK